MLRDKLISIGLFFLFFIVYILNSSRSIYAGDVGDLVSAAAVGGVAHPPGYPLFTFLGFILTHLHLGSFPSFQVGLISVIAGSLAVVVWYFLIKRLTKNSLVSVISSLILAFIYPFWFYNEIAEVFALNSFFAILLTYLAIIFADKRKKSILYLFFFVLGLSFTNHQTIILILPSLFILLYAKDLSLKFSHVIARSHNNKRRSNLFQIRRLPHSFRTFAMTVIKSRAKLIDALRIMTLVLFSFALGLTPFLYIPIASSHHPIINWDNVHDLSSFFQLIFRKDYGTFSAGSFMKSTFQQSLVTLEIYGFIFSSQLSIPVIALSLLGMVSLFIKKQYRYILSFLLAVIISEPLFIFYASFPLNTNFLFEVNERFFTLSFIYFLFFFPFGIILFSEIISNMLGKKVYLILFQAIFLIIPIYLFIYNFPKTNLSNISTGENLVVDFLSPLPKHSIIFLSGDTDLFNSRYMEYAKHFREDVVLADLVGAVGDSRYQAMLSSTIKRNRILSTDELDVNVMQAFSNDYEIFSENDWQPKKGNKKFIWVPYGLTVKYITNKDDIPKEDEYIHLTNMIWSKMHVIKKDASIAQGSLSIADFPDTYANSLIRTANFFIAEYSDNVMAKAYYEKALEVDPNYPKTYEFIGAYYLTVGKLCDKAAINFSKAISLNPQEIPAYFLLYTTYKNCLHNDTNAKQVTSDFQRIFHEDFLSLYSKQPKSTI